jgi:hypothetical protein
MTDKQVTKREIDMAEIIPSLPYKSVAVDDSDEWMEQLQTDGYTVVGGVANNDQVEEARRLLWDWLAGLGTGIKREQPSTWKDEAWPDWPGMKKYGTCKTEGAAHQGATWYMRGLPSLKKVFATIYGTEDGVHGWDDYVETLAGYVILQAWLLTPSYRPKPKYKARVPLCAGDATTVPGKCRGRGNCSRAQKS